MPPERDESNAPPAGPPRPFVGVYFDCCGVYVRVYRKPGEMRYVGRCPRCLRVATLNVGADGTSERIFRAS